VHTVRTYTTRVNSRDDFRATNDTEDDARVDGKSEETGMGHHELILDKTIHTDGRDRLPVQRSRVQRDRDDEEILEGITEKLVQ